jgi:hypothetical protein
MESKGEFVKHNRQPDEGLSPRNSCEGSAFPFAATDTWSETDSIPNHNLASSRPRPRIRPTHSRPLLKELASMKTKGEFIKHDSQPDEELSSRTPVRDLLSPSQPARNGFKPGL